MLGKSYSVRASLPRIVSNDISADLTVRNTRKYWRENIVLLFLDVPTVSLGKNSSVRLLVPAAGSGAAGVVQVG